MAVDAGPPDTAPNPRSAFMAGWRQGLDDERAGDVAWADAEWWRGYLAAVYRRGGQGVRRPDANPAG